MFFRSWMRFSSTCPERQKLTDGRPTADAEAAKLTAATAANDNATMKTMATNAVFLLFINIYI